MNCSVYLFGNLSNGYTQYPDDYSRNIFTKFHENAKATTQIAIHRTSNLMYYAYVRKIEEGEYVGLCVLLNDVYLTKIDGLFSLFENTISNMVSKGFLIKFDDKGNVVGNAGKLYLNKEEVGLIGESLKVGFSNLESSAQKLPALNYGINKDSVHEYTIDDETEEIIKSTFTNGFTYIYKSKGYNTAQMNSYKGVLAKITKEKNEVKEENQRLKAENEKILRQKKQYKNILILLLLLFAGLAFMFQLNNNLVSTQEQLDSTRSILDSTRSTVTEQNSQIENLQAKEQNLTEQLGNVRKELSEAHKEINEKNNTIAQKSDKINELETSVNSLQKDKSSLQKELSTASFTISSLKSEYSTLQQNYQIILKQKNELWTEKTRLENQLQNNNGKRKKKP